MSQSETGRSPELIRQAEVLRRLHRFLKEERLSISVPEVVPSVSGELLVKDRQYGWSLTRHLEGFHPEFTNPEVYPALIEGLARFHRTLRLFSEQQPIVAAQGINRTTRQSIERLGRQSFVPFTRYAREEEVLARAAEWLLPRLADFERLPRQLVHGDWTPRNVLFGFRDQTSLLTGVLDFEEMSIDPVHVDVANVCSTLLMWSGLHRPEQHMRGVLNAYEKLSANRLELAEIQTSMLAHWFCHYWKWRDRIESGGLGDGVKERLCMRIESVLDFLNGTPIP